MRAGQAENARGLHSQPTQPTPSQEDGAKERGGEVTRAWRAPKPEAAPSPTPGLLPGQAGRTKRKPAQGLQPAPLAGPSAHVQELFSSRIIAGGGAARATAPASLGGAARPLPLLGRPLASSLRGGDVCPHPAREGPAPSFLSPPPSRLSRAAYLRWPGPPFYFLNHSHNAPRERRAKSACPVYERPFRGIRCYTEHAQKGGARRQVSETSSKQARCPSPFALQTAHVQGTSARFLSRILSLISLGRRARTHAHLWHRASERPRLQRARTRMGLFGFI